MACALVQEAPHEYLGMALFALAAAHAAILLRDGTVPGAVFQVRFFALGNAVSIAMNELAELGSRPLVVPIEPRRY